MKILLNILPLIILVSLTASRCCKKDNSCEEDVPVVVSISGNITIDEGTSDENTKVTITAKLDMESVTYPVEVDYFLINESTTDDDLNFIASDNAKTLVFNEGETQKTFTVEIIADDDFEPNEEFSVRLTNPLNAILGSQKTVVVKIINDDVCTSGCGFTSPETYAGYTLVWSDEFSGTSVDTEKWVWEEGGGGWGNNELQYYTNRSENTYMENGNLIIEARKESYNGSDYTSARLITAGKYSVQYGRIDIRAILPDARGTWPALWMLGDNIWSAGWPACGEIDIMELVGYDPNKVHATAHWGESKDNKGISGGSYENSEGFSSQYHVYSLVWDNNGLSYLVDDQEIHYVPRNAVTGFTYPFDQKFFFIFNIAIGGDWGGLQGIDDSAFPQKMYVDYVRVFQ